MEWKQFYRKDGKVYFDTECQVEVSPEELELYKQADITDQDKIDIKKVLKQHKEEQLNSLNNGLRRSVELLGLIGEGATEEDLFKIGEAAAKAEMVIKYYYELVNTLSTTVKLTYDPRKEK